MLKKQMNTNEFCSFSTIFAKVVKNNKITIDFQKQLFRVLKVILLNAETIAFAMQKDNF